MLLHPLKYLFVQFKNYFPFFLLFLIDFLVEFPQAFDHRVVALRGQWDSPARGTFILIKFLAIQSIFFAIEHLTLLRLLRISITWIDLLCQRPRWTSPLLFFRLIDLIGFSLRLLYLDDTKVYLKLWLRPCWAGLIYFFRFDVRLPKRLLRWFCKDCICLFGIIQSYIWGPLISLYGIPYL